MKHVNNLFAYLIGTFFLCFNPLLSQGWVSQNSGVSAALRGVCFTDANTGTVVGSSGIILRTTNGGTNWFSQSSGTSNGFAGIYFSSATIATAVGANGTIVRTTNSGQNWIIQNSTTTANLADVFFTDINTGIVVGGSGTILRTTNGGVDWLSKVSGTSNNLSGVNFTSSSIGFAVASGGTILKTTNGGETWISQSSGIGSNLNDIHFSDLNNGTIVGSGGVILRTTNGGTSWFSQTSGTLETLHGIYFVNAEKGIAVGDNGMILRTTNGGNNWTAQTSGTALALFSVFFTDENTGTAVGASGKILRTTTGGVDCPLITLYPTTLSNGIVFTFYSHAITASGGVAPYNYSVSAGSLPNGITLTTSGVLSGIPSSAGTFNLTITATDDNNCQGNQDYILTIDCPTITVSPSSLPNGSCGSFYSENVNASGGSAPYNFSLASGNLPPGLSLSSSGSLFGTPSMGGIYNFSLRATDMQACTGDKNYSIMIHLSLSPITLPDGTVGTPYNQAISTNCGTAPFTYTISSGDLPNGLILAPSGVLSGTPNTVGDYNFTITSTDFEGITGSQSYSMIIDCPTITLLPFSLQNCSVGTLYNQTITAMNGTAPYYYLKTSGLLPPGLILSLSGDLTGIPTTVGSYSFTVTATDAKGCTGDKNYTLTIDCPTLTFNPPTLPKGVVGESYSKMITVSGGTSPYNYTITSGSLPNGLTLTSVGILAGTPTTIGSYLFTVSAIDAQGCTGNKSYTLVVDCPIITMNPLTLINGTVNTPYSQMIIASGGTSPYTFALSSGLLPNGITMSSSGIFSGTPTIVGNYSFSITVTDAQDCQATESYSIVINCPTISLSSLSNGTVGVTYNQSIVASNGTSPYSFNITGGNLPTGLTLSNDGLLSGTPTAAGDFTFTVTATDIQGCLGSSTYTLTMSCPIITLSALPNGTVGTSYNETIIATGGTSPYSFDKISGTLPSGVSLSSSGLLLGTPTAAGSFSFTIEATDNYGCKRNQSYTLIMNCPSITIAPSSLPNGTVSIPYNQIISASGGVSPYSFSIMTGNLPPGLILSSSGVLSGTPTSNGMFLFTVTATDVYNCSANFSYSIIIGNCPTIILSPTTLSNGQLGTAYSQVLSANGGYPPYSFEVISGALPSGLALSSSGILSGTPSSSGRYTFMIRATDGIGCIGNQSYTLIICETITMSPLPNGTIGVVYDQIITAGNGTPPYTFSKISGTLPNGLTLFSSGILNGTPTSIGNFSFTIDVIDASGCNGSQNYYLVINNPIITISPSILPSGMVGLFYHQILGASGGTPPYNFALASGSLPSGLTLSSTGTISGNPTTVGNFTFTITATDAYNSVGSQTFVINVNCSAITITPFSLPPGTVGLSYNQTINVSGGTAPYSFILSDGMLPAGINLSSSGNLTGTPTHYGNSTFSITAIDAQGCTKTQAYNLSINCPIILISPPNLPNGQVGITYSQSLTATGGSSPYTFMVSGGSLPNGLLLSSSGVISGIPLSGGNFNFSITATDIYGCTSNQSYVLTIGVTPAFSVTPTNIFFGNVDLGSDKIDSIIVTNIGTGNLNIFSVSSTNGQYTALPNTMTIPAGESRKFIVTFIPITTGYQSGNIIFTHNASGSPTIVNVTGTGIIPGFWIVPRIVFGNVAVGTSKKDSITITNNGTQTLNINSIFTDHSEFSITPSGGSIPAFENKQFYVMFNPTTTGLKFGNIVFNHNAIGSPDTVEVNGSGVAPMFSVSPSNLNFGNVALGSSKFDSVTITNTGTSSLNITSVTSTNETFFVMPASSSIEPAGSRKFYIIFTPTICGSHSGQVIFTHDAVGSPNSIPVTGTATVLITLVKLQDIDGSPNTINDQIPKRWYLALFKNSVSDDNLIAASDTNILSTIITQAGIYIACEADSGLTWTRINGNRGRYDTLVVSLNETILDTFINFRKNSIVIRKFEDADGDFNTM
ncbi:MAG: putative Ig domain-containing protein [Bacteroidota bacterium]|nr:putative Ig domain-containing protein [Bacteroidota bacterium]